MTDYTCLHIFNLQKGKGEELGVWSSSDIGKFKSLFVAGVFGLDLASSMCQHKTYHSVGIIVNLLYIMYPHSQIHVKETTRYNLDPLANTSDANHAVCLLSKSSQITP
jgi:hypothetical protein